MMGGNLCLISKACVGPGSKAGKTHMFVQLVGGGLIPSKLYTLIVLISQGFAGSDLLLRNAVVNFPADSSVVGPS